MSARVQQWIHYIEEGSGAKAITIAAAILGFIALAVLYDIGSFQNFNSEEAMDVSQLARNIATGEGYTTDYIRPASLNLVEARANKKAGIIQQKLLDNNLPTAERAALEKKRDALRDMAQLKSRHPDISNAPAYPVLLAGLMKVAPIDYTISKKKSFSSYAPEIWIAALNQFLFLIAAIVLYKISRQLFDRPVAIISSVLFGATELFWRFSIAGIPTMLLVLIFLCLAWALVKFNAANANGAPQPFRWAILAGILVGLGCLTRYSFGWLILPVVAFFLLFGTEHSIKAGFIALVTFFVVISPWLARNYSLSGNFFGTAGYALCEGTPKFQEDRLERSLERGTVFGKVYFSDYLRKWMQNSRGIFENEVPKLGGSWLTLLFLAGLLVPLASPAQSRMRIFLLCSFLVLWFAEALGKSHLSADSPITSEHFLILVTPLIFMFGVALYFDLFRRIVFSEPVYALVTTLVFCGIISAPLLFALLPPAVNPSAYPPYFPPIIQETSGWMRRNELIMSDVPWAVAWYGNRQSVPLSLTYPKDFLTFNDDIKSIQALYLTPRSTDKRFLSEMVKDRESWGRFILESISRGEVPDKFPLKKAPSGFLPDQVFLTDWERWTKK